MPERAWTRRIPAILAGTLIALAAVAAMGEPRVVDLAVRGSALPPDRQVIRVQQGDEVTLRWTTDTALTVHLHGYDLETRLTPGAPTVMRFSARATGRFPIEVHGGAGGKEKTLGYLEVHPR